MQIFSRWPESQARILRWVLMLGWLLLIISLFPGNFAATGDDPNLCRICPLAFVSQLFIALGRQRTEIGKGGKPEVVKVNTDSWLGRNHIQLQWSLLIAGLSLRLLVVNSNPLCSMAHMGSSKISQSMCRTITDSGKEQSACVACQAPCLDIDIERHFWSNLAAKPGLEWAWYSYPGLVLSFFELMRRMVSGATYYSAHVVYLRNGLWAFDTTLPQRILQPIERPDGLRAFQLPSEAFEELLHRSRYFSRGLIRQLAQRLTAAML